MSGLLTKENPFFTHYLGEEAEPRHTAPVRSPRKPSHSEERRFTIERSLVPNHPATSDLHEELYAREILDRLKVKSYTHQIEAQSLYHVDVTSVLFGQQPDLRATVRLIKQWFHRIAPALAENELEHLRALYNLRESDRITAFIHENQFLLGLLSEAPDRIHNCFGSDVQLALELSQDPEDSESQELFIRILTELPSSKAFILLDRLDEEWWLDASDRAEGKLNLRLEYV